MQERIDAGVDLQALPGIGPQWDLKLRQLSAEGQKLPESNGPLTPLNSTASNSQGEKEQSSGDFPFLEIEGHHSRQVQVRLSREHAAILSGLREGLKHEHAQLRDGRHVELNADVIRYILEFANRATN